MSYFTFQEETPARRKLERKQYDTWFRKKTIHIDIGYKSTHQQTDKWQKDAIDEEATLI